MAARRDKYEVQHLANMAKYDKQVWEIFKKVCHEAGLSVNALETIVKSAGKNADFAKIPTVRKVLDMLQKKLAEGLKTTVVNGIKAEWKLANTKYDALVGTMVAGDLMEQMDEAHKARMMAQNTAVRDAFITRKERGLDLSQRVWNYTGQMRDAMEIALETGIWEGRSAAEVARELQQYLKYPDKLFRRVRDKETGELKLSQPARLFHPGQGVYRSSYQNALRLARTETNIAYRKADTVRRIGLDFVVGIEVHLSNNHNAKGVPEGEFHDICDELQGKYPPYFDFSGWHPNCRCWTSTILQTEDEFIRDSDGRYRGSVNEVKDVPPAFKEWVEKNRDRIDHAAEGGKLAYFLRDNRWAWDEDAEKPKKQTIPDAVLRAEARHEARTEEQVAAIRERWDMRQRAQKNQRNVVALVNAVPGMKEYLKDNTLPAAYKIVLEGASFNGDYDSLNYASELVRKEMTYLKKRYDFLEKPWEVFKEYGVEKTVAAAQAIEAKLNSFKQYDLEKRLEKLRFEADWTEKNKKYSTWEIARDAYLKAADKVEWEIEWKELNDRLNTAAQNQYADPSIVAEARSYIGVNKTEAEIAIDNLELSIKRNELDAIYKEALAEAPGAFPPEVRESVEKAINEGYSGDVQASKILVKQVLNQYRVLKGEIEAYLKTIKDTNVVNELHSALASQSVVKMQDVVNLAARAELFQTLVVNADEVLKQRDLLLKLKPQVVTWLEERKVPKDYSAEDVVKLKSAIENAEWTIDEWEKKKKKYADYFQYMIKENIKLKEYQNLVMEARDAVQNIDVAKLDETFIKLDEQKAKYEKEKAYREGIKAEWEKMMADVKRIEDTIVLDTDLLKKAVSSGLAALIGDFDGNYNGARKMREARKTYQQIVEKAKALGLQLGEVYTDNGVTFGPGMVVKKFDEKDFSDKRKDKATWYKDEASSRKKYGPLAKEVIDNATAEERAAFRAYTGGSGFINRPLRGYDGDWYTTPKGIGKVPLDNESSDAPQKIKDLTALISRSTYDFDVWLQRGVNDRGMKGLLGVDNLDETTLNSLVGQTFIDTAYFSCGSSRGTGFREQNILNIYCPKGTQMIYLEGNSAYNNQGENETLIQRNTHFRLIKVEVTSYRRYFDFEVVAQI